MPIEIMKVYWSTDLELQAFSNNFNRAVLDVTAIGRCFRGDRYRL